MGPDLCDFRGVAAAAAYALDSFGGLCWPSNVAQGRSDFRAYTAKLGGVYASTRVGSYRAGAYTTARNRRAKKLRKAKLTRLARKRNRRNL